MVDDTGCVVFWNEAAARMFGYSADEALGQDLAAIAVPPRFHAFHHDNFASFLKAREKMRL